LAWAAGKRTLVVRAGKEGTSVILEIWGRCTIDKELHIPTQVHGLVFNDGWFSSGVSWDPDELRIAYVAEACLCLNENQSTASMLVPISATLFDG